MRVKTSLKIKDVRTKESAKTDSIPSSAIAKVQGSKGDAARKVSKHKKT